MMGGGVLIDGGVHWVNSLLTLGGGDASDVKAVESQRSLPRCPGEDTIVVTCLLKSGAVGVLTYSWNIEPAFPDRFIAVHGEEGSAYAENRGKFGVTFIGKRLRPKFFPRRDREGFFAMWRDFRAQLTRGGESHCLASGLMGRRDLAFVEAAYRSLGTPDRYLARRAPALGSSRAPGSVAARALQLRPYILSPFNVDPGSCQRSRRHCCGQRSRRCYGRALAR